MVISGTPPATSSQGDPAPTSRAGVGRPDAGAGPSRPRLQRLLMVAAAVVVLRGTQAVVAVVTVVVIATAHLRQPMPQLHVVRLTEVELRPLTPLTALVMVAVSATVTIVLLRCRRTLTAFAAVKAFALLVAAVITGALAAGPGAVRLAVAGCGVSLAVLMWPAVRRAAVAVLTAVGLPHPAGRLADLALAAKIGLLVALVVLLP